MAMYEGYFDESGDLDCQPGIFCLAGYYMTADAAKTMDVEWQSVLHQYRVSYFHMVDCARGAGEFAALTMEQRIAIETELIILIKKHTIAGFAAIANAAYFETSEKYSDSYSAYSELCVISLQSFLETNRLDGEIAYFFESGHRNKHSAYCHVAKRLDALGAPLAFATKEQVRLLQAADLLGWQAVKYVKDGISGRRTPRKDFLSLVEHRHT